MSSPINYNLTSTHPESAVSKVSIDLLGAQANELRSVLTLAARTKTLGVVLYKDATFIGSTEPFFPGSYPVL